LGEPFEIELDETALITEPTPRELVSLSNWSQPHFGMPPQLYVRVRRQLPLKAPAGLLPQTPRFAAAAVRLAVGGTAYTSDVAVMPFVGVPGGYGSMSYRMGFPPPMTMGTTSLVTPESSDEIKRYYAGLQRLDERFAVVLDRYHSAAAKVSPDERLIDSVIGIEALLMAGSDASTEVTYRFALTGSWLLAPDARDRQQLFDKLRDLYGYRSDIVHGNRRRRETHDPDPPGTALELLRQLLRTVVRRGDDWDSWVEHRRRVIFGTEELGVENDSAAPSADAISDD
jgi:hypothetical protein